jgi:hypothetical protein
MGFALSDAADPNLELYKLYLETAEKVSERRAEANTWMLSVNSAIVALYGYLSEAGASVGDFEKSVWLWAIPVAGIVVCLAWATLPSGTTAVIDSDPEITNRSHLEMAFSNWRRERGATEED